MRTLRRAPVRWNSVRSDFDIYTRIIQKISSVCEYCRFSAAVTMVRMRAQFVDSVTRHGHILQTFEQFLRVVLCVYNV